MNIKTFLIWCASGLACLGCAGPAVAQPALTAASAMQAKQVAASTWYVQGESALGTPANRNFISNAGFVITPAGVVVIDALGSPALARELITIIGSLTDQPVTHVIVTHYHADHIYGLQEFKRLGARIVAHRGALAYLHSDAARLRLDTSRKQLSPWIDGKTTLIEADDWLDSASELRVGEVRFILQPLGPAHTPEDLAVFVPTDNVLFAGDLVFRGRLPFVGNTDSRQWIRSLDTLLAFGARVVVPGHGRSSTSATDDIALTRDYLLYLRKSMGRAARELEPFDEAYRATDWSQFEQLPLFQTANRMNAYNTYLLMERDPD